MSKREQINIGCLVVLIVLTGIIAAVIGPILAWPINRAPVAGLIIGVVAFLIGLFMGGPIPCRFSLRECLSDLIICEGLILTGLSLLWMAKIIPITDVIRIVVVICDASWGVALILISADEIRNISRDLCILYKRFRHERESKAS